MLVKDFLEILESLAPRRLALEWDNSGLQVGDPGAEVRRAALALDPSTSAIRRAISEDCQLLITHHPLIFRPIKSLNPSDPAVKPVFEAAKAGLAVACAHTNWDAAGVSLELAERLKLKPLRPLEDHPEPLSKIVAFVPKEQARNVRQAAFEAGAGVIGDYPECFFQAPGVGGFKVPAWGRPFSGTPGESHQTPEERLEVIVPRSLAARAAAAAKAAHPYEEPAIEIYDLSVPGRGFGLLGLWEPAMEPVELLELLGRIFGDAVLWAGPEPGKTSLVALMPGSGGDCVSRAAAAGAQLLITGDVGHHHALLAAEADLPVLSAGHFQTERPGLERLAREIALKLERAELEAELEVLAEEPPLRRLHSTSGS